MYVDAVATQSEVDTFDDNEKMVRWNGHAVVELYEMGDSTFVQRIVQNQESKISLRKRDIKPLMQVVRNGDASINGRVDNNGDWEVEGRVTFRFGGKEESDNKNENNNDTYDRPDPPDSRDRDFDKD